MNKSETGEIGESIACGYLVDKGYEILDRNYWKKFGEIDIVAKSPSKTLVFIEVKTTKIQEDDVNKSPASYPQIAGVSGKDSRDHFKPEDKMSASKMDKFRKICQWYANSHPELAGGGYQLDVMAVILRKDGADVKHYENV